MLSRREFAKVVAAGLPVAANAANKIDSLIQGVQFGLQTYSFTGLGLPQQDVLDIVVKSMVGSGLGECDLFGSLTEPALSRAELAEWRKSISPEYYSAIRKKFNDAGIEIYGLSGFPGSTEEELGRTFRIADICGAQIVTLGVPLSTAKRLVSLTEKSKFIVGIQGRPDMTVTNPDVIAKPENYEEALSLSKKYSISIDLGDAVGGGYDVLRFVEDHYDRIAMVYLKDRRKDRLSMPWGQGDTPIREILRLIRDRNYPIRCYLDCDYKTTDRAADVQASFQYAKAALE